MFEEGTMISARSTRPTIVGRPSRAVTTGYWIATSLFALQMGFTAYAQLRLPQVAAAFTHLGFPPYFRIELSWLKIAGILVLLFPAPERLKEWAYAGFAITLGSALVAHLSVGDDVSKWSWPAGTAVLWAVSYVLFRKLTQPDASIETVGDRGRAPAERQVTA
jgi:DoxX-like family